MYPNSYSDYEVSCFEPYYKWIPTQTKSWFYKIFAILITPVLHVTFFHNMWRYRFEDLNLNSTKQLQLVASLSELKATFGRRKDFSNGTS